MPRSITKYFACNLYYKFIGPYLDQQREVVLGPDLSDRRNVMQSVVKARDVQDAIRRESIQHKISMLEAERRAIGYVNEIVSDYSASAVRFARYGFNPFMDTTL